MDINVYDVRAGVEPPAPRFTEQALARDDLASAPEQAGEHVGLTVWELGLGGTNPEHAGGQIKSDRAGLNDRRLARRRAGPSVSQDLSPDELGRDGKRVEDVGSEGKRSGRLDARDDWGRIGAALVAPRPEGSDTADIPLNQDGVRVPAPTCAHDHRGLNQAVGGESLPYAGNDGRGVGDNEEQRHGGYGTGVALETRSVRADNCLTDPSRSFNRWAEP